MEWVDAHAPKAGAYDEACPLTDVSKSLSAFSFGDLDLDANHVGGDVSWTPPENDAGIDTYETYLATDVSFGDLDLDANHVGGDVSRTPPENDAGIETCETYLATDAGGSGGVLLGGVAIGTNVYAVSSDADSTGKAHIVVYTKSVLVEQTTPVALALTDESLSVSAVSFGDRDLDALQIGGGLSFTPPGNPSSLAWGLKVYIAKESAGSDRSLVLAGSYSGSNSLAVPADTASAADFSHIVAYTESSLLFRP